MKGSRMAKSDSFFIRAGVDVSAGSTEQIAIDLGAYVDALGKSVLRIHNVECQVAPVSGVGVDYNLPANTNTHFAWQITTQSQTGLVFLDDKSVIASGRLEVINDTPTANLVSSIEKSLDVGPQHFTNGYLVGVEQIYLRGDCDAQMDDSRIAVILECTVETLSQSGAMALALSQQ